MVYSNTIVYGGNEYGISVTCIFSLFEALNNTFEVHFSGFHFYTLSQNSDSMQGHAVQICF